MLAVQSTPSVRANNVAVALGNSGAPALVAAAMPNFTNTFSPAGLTYWLSTSPLMLAGQILPSFNNSNAVQLNFPPGVNALTATLASDGIWLIQPS